MKKCFYFLLVFLTSQSAAAQLILSDQAEISVITCGPGQEAVFTAFGHSAFRVYDPVNEIDAAFNYGVFDFNQPNFYLNFARGKNRYRLAVQDYKRFEYTYIYYNRYIHEQVLNLAQSQKQKLFDYLQWNAQPENQFYLYDYFYDNCATKIPGVLLAVFGDSVRFDGRHITTAFSIRELTDLYLTYQPWGDLGIDICLGLPMDKKASPFEYMFIPDFVETGFDHAFINGSPLVKEKRIIYESRHEVLEVGLIQPLYIFLLFGFVIAGFAVYDLKRKKISNWLDILLFGIFGLLGVLLLLLWVATDHRAAAYNLNLLWALPTHLVFAFAVFQNRNWIKKYALGILVINAVLLLSWPWLPQLMHYSLIPLVVAIALRCYARYKLS